MRRTDRRDLNTTVLLALMGPGARDVLQAVAQGDLSNKAFPFGTFQ